MSLMLPLAAKKLSAWSAAALLLSGLPAIDSVSLAADQPVDTPGFEQIRLDDLQGSFLKPLRWEQ